MEEGKVPILGLDLWEHGLPPPPPPPSLTYELSAQPSSLAAIRRPQPLTPPKPPERR